jgi:hypothetical protein
MPYTIWQSSQIHPKKTAILIMEIQGAKRSPEATVLLPEPVPVSADKSAKFPKMRIAAPKKRFASAERLQTSFFVKLAKSCALNIIVEPTLLRETVLPCLAMDAHNGVSSPVSGLQNIEDH